VVVTLAFSALEHGGYDGESLVGGRDLLDVRLNLLVGWLLLASHLLLVLLEIVDVGLAGLVRVKLARLLAVGLCQLVLRRAGLDAEEVVEGDILALRFGDFITDTEDFVV